MTNNPKRGHPPAHAFRDGQDLTKGSIRSERWNVAWPIMLSVFFYTLYNIVDAYWVSKLSAEAIAAVSISQITLSIMISLGFGITVGSGVLMAMQIGAKNLKEAERILGQSFVLSAILAAFFTVVALVFRNELLAFSGASPSRPFPRAPTSKSIPDFVSSQF